MWLYTFFSKRSKRLCSFSWRKKKEPKEHPPNQAFPIWKDVIDYDGDPLRQGFGIALEPLPLWGSRLLSIDWRIESEGIKKLVISI